MGSLKQVETMEPRDNDQEADPLVVKSQGRGANEADSGLSRRTSHAMVARVIGIIALLAAIIATAAELRCVRHLPFPAKENKSRIDQLRLELAFLSIEMMQNDTAQAAEESVLVDIGSFYDFIDEALDEIGIHGVYIELFDTPRFRDALGKAAVAKGLNNFYTYTTVGDHQPETHYFGIPNDRKFAERGDDYLCHGCIWWLYHFVGAVTAEKLLRDESLLLTSTGGTEDYVYNASSFIRELHFIQRMEDVDLVAFHSEHGFIWQYITSSTPLLDAYPQQLAKDFCGDLLPTDDEESAVGTSVARECWHSFGHSMFYALAMRETWGDAKKYNFRMTFLPSGGYVLSEKSVCEGYRLCNQAPNEKHALRECFGGFRHSIKLYRPEGEQDKNLGKDIQNQWKRCMDE